MGADLRCPFLGADLRSSIFRGRPSVVQFLGADLRSSIFRGRPSVVQFLGADLRSISFFYQNFIFLSIFHFLSSKFIFFVLIFFLSKFRSSNFLGATFGRPICGADLRSSNFWGWPSVQKRLQMYFVLQKLALSRMIDAKNWHFGPKLIKPTIGLEHRKRYGSIFRKPERLTNIRKLYCNRPQFGEKIFSLNRVEIGINCEKYSDIPVEKSSWILEKS